MMEDLKLKHFIHSIETRGIIRFDWKDTGESFIPRISDFKRYEEFYVTGIYVRNNELVFRIQAEI